MNTIVTDLVMVLLHTLWQAMAIAAAVCALLCVLPARRPGLRYDVCVAALALVVMSAAGTWALRTRPHESRAAVAVTNNSGTGASPVHFSDRHGSGARAANGAAEATTRSAPSQLVRSVPPRTTMQWPTVAAGVWGCGVALMLVRMAFLVAGARRVTRHALPLENPEILATVDRLRERLRMIGNVRVLVAERLISPAVVGMIRPTILLPASLLSGVPADQLEAILLHELAHIRRWDYLINLMQLIIEALLFFNPAVWWISRQIRIEREACCDAVAVGFTGRPVRYAEVLADWLSSMRGPQTPELAMAMSGHEEKPTLDRVSRILLPNYRPRLRLSWPSLAAVLLVSALLIAGLWRGTETAVTFAADVLSPRQRMESLIAATQSAVPMQIAHSDNPKDRVKISGTIRTIDGKPLLPGGMINTDVRATNHGTSASLGPAVEKFSGTAPPGIIYISVAGVPGYAPASVGPFIGTHGATLPPIEIVLEKGFAARVKVVDDAGQPIRDVSVDWSIDLQGGGHIRNVKSDADGFVNFDNAIAVKYSLTAAISGFEVEKREVRLTPGATITWPLQRAAATSGIVLDAAGNVLADSELRKFAELEGERVHDQDWRAYKVLAKTDAQGRFTLPSLRSDRTYILLIESPDKRQMLVRDVKAGQPDRRLQFAPPKIIEGRVTGDLSRLPKDKGTPVISFSYSFRLGGHGYSSMETNVPVTIDGEGGSFEIRDPLALPIRIFGMNYGDEVDASKPLTEPVVVHLAKQEQLSKRQVIVRLIGEPDAPAPRGTIVLTPSVKEHYDYKDSKTVELKDGQARIDAPAGGKLHVTFKELIGCWVPKRDFMGNYYDVPIGEGAFQIDIPTIPAGAVTGTLLDHEGKPTLDGHTLMSVYEVTKSPRLAGNQKFSFDNSYHPTSGKFMLSPLPLGGTYRVMASFGKTRVFSDEIKVDEATPLPNVDLQFPRGVEVEVRVLDPTGKPIASAPVDFSYNGPFGSHGYSPTPLTDSSGVIRFEAVNPDVPGKYTIRVPFEKRYQPLQAEPRLDGRPTVIQVKEGLPLKGRVMLQPAGTPLADAEVFANPLPSTGEFRQFKAEGKTSEKGDFVFSNLAPGEYSIHASPPRWPGKPYQMPNATATAGQTDEVEVVIKLVEQ